MKNEVFGKKFIVELDFLNWFMMKKIMLTGIRIYHIYIFYLCVEYQVD